MWVLYVSRGPFAKARLNSRILSELHEGSIRATLNAIICHCEIINRPTTRKMNCVQAEHSESPDYNFTWQSSKK